MAQYGMQPRGNRFSPRVQGPPRDSSMLAQVAEKRLKDRAGNAPPVPQTAAAPVTRQTPTAAPPPPPSVAPPVAPTTPAVDPRAQARQQAIQNIRGQQPSLPGMTQLPSAPGQQITPTAPDGGLNIKKQAIQQAAAQKAAAQEKAQEPGDLPPPSDPDFFGEAGTGFGESDEFGVEGQPYGAEKSQFEEEELPFVGESQPPGEGSGGADDVTKPVLDILGEADWEGGPEDPEGFADEIKAAEEEPDPPFGGKYTNQPEDEATEDEVLGEEDNALKTQAEKELQSILSGEGEFGMTDEELANQEAIIQKAAQQAKADLSQQMSGRGLGMSGIAGAGFGNIDAQSITAMQDLKFKNAQLAIDEKLNTLNSISKLYGHLLSEEDRMKIAEMQFGLENQKFEYQKEADAESNWWADMNDMLALTGSDRYSAEALEFAQKAREAGYSPAEITDALETFDDDDPGTEGKEVSVTVNKDSDLWKKVMGEEEGEPPAENPWDIEAEELSKYWDYSGFQDYASVNAWKESNGPEFPTPPPGWPYSTEAWDGLSISRRQEIVNGWGQFSPGFPSGEETEG